MKRFFNSQIGAMFSMDARIALVVGSILAGTIGVQVVQKIQRDRVELAEASALELVKALDNYAIDHPQGPLPASPPAATTFNTGTNNFAELVLDGGYAQDAALRVDPWGTNWNWDACSAMMNIEGVQVTVYYAVVYSAGPDGLADSGTGDFLANATCQDDYGAWAPVGDDIGAKYSTLELERNRAIEYKRRAQTVIGALQAYESQRFIANQQFCAIPANQSEDRCNWYQDPILGNTPYATGIEARMNYYPISSIDSLATGVFPNNFYYDMHDGSGGARWVFGTFVLGTDYTTEDMLKMIGLPIEYATDPWGRRLCYQSNASGATTAPFIATVKYSAACP